MMETSPFAETSRKSQNSHENFQVSTFQSSFLLDFQTLPNQNLPNHLPNHFLLIIFFLRFDLPPLAAAHRSGGHSLHRRTAGDLLWLQIPAFRLPRRVPPGHGTNGVSAWETTPWLVTDG